MVDIRPEAQGWPPEDFAMEVTSVTVVEYLTPEGRHRVFVDAVDATGEWPPLTACLGVLDHGRLQLWDMERWDEAGEDTDG